MKPVPRCICEHCKVEFYVRPYRKATAKYCSRLCKDAAHKKIIGDAVVCAGCHEIKSKAQFYPDRSRPRGYVARCKSCYGERQKIDRLKPGKRYGEIKGNAVRRGLGWFITKDDYSKLWGQPCYYCGESSRGGLDRWNNEPYYRIENVRPCCGACNQMKSKMRAVDFIERCAKIATLR